MAAVKASTFSLKSSPASHLYLSFIYHLSFTFIFRVSRFIFRVWVRGSGFGVKGVMAAVNASNCPSKSSPAWCLVFEVGIWGCGFVFWSRGLGVGVEGSGVRVWGVGAGIGVEV